MFICFDTVKPLLQLIFKNNPKERKGTQMQQNCKEIENVPSAQQYGND